MIPINFSETSATMVCSTTERLKSFLNSSSDELIIMGAKETGGSDPMGNFYFQSIIVNGVEQETNNGSLGEVHVPAGGTYNFKVRYTPKANNGPHRSLLDVVYSKPREGVIQIALEGKPTGENRDCQGENNTEEAFPIDGDAFLHVTKLVAATSLIEGAINTDQGSVPFVPIDLPLRFDAASKRVTFPAITGENFQLPPPGERAHPTLRQVGITQPTVVTSTGEASGTFEPANGSITIENAHIIMNGDFRAELTVTLTTEKQRNNLSPVVSQTALEGVGTLWNSVTHELSGQRVVMSNQGSVVLIGFIGPAQIENVETRLSQLDLLDEASMAVVIYGNLRAASEPPPTTH